MAKLIGNCIAYVDGFPKKVGALFDKGRGRYAIKIDLMPVGSGWDGWITAFPPDEDDGTRKNSGRRWSPAELERFQNARDIADEHLRGERDISIDPTKATGYNDDDIPF